MRHFLWTPLFLAALAVPAGAGTGSPPVCIGETVLAQGLAMRVARNQFPDRPETEFVEARPGWLAEAGAKRNRILRDIRAVLNDNDARTVAEFTVGTGPSGIEREAYYAGWIVTGYLLAHGVTEAEIARVKAEDAPARVGEAIDKMLAETGR